jgi:myo-inositol-1(or 4)-monophosphatase
MNHTDLNDFKSFCKFLAYKSAEIIKQYFRTEINVESKADLSPVTIADKKSEEVMREVIMKEFPDHGILGEEFGIHNEKAEYQWVLDPIDGTKSFISGTPLFGTLIALLKNGNPILGAINLPVLNQYLVGENSSAELNDEKVQARECRNLKDATLLTSDFINIGNYHDEKKFLNLAGRVKIFRGWGDCYGYYLLASGYADIMIDPIMSVWDLMALIPIIRGAGGVITDYQGKDAAKGSSIVAASIHIHPEVIKIIN